MFQNHFKIAWRNFTRNKLSSFINVAGLALGMSVAILIGLWIWDELSFNTYHTNYKQLVEVMDHQERQGRKNSNFYLPVPLAAELRSSFGSDFKQVAAIRKTEKHILVSGEKKFTQAGNYMEAPAPEMFSLEMLQGTRHSLSQPNSILLSQTLAKKFFADADPMDKIITVDADTEVKVSGVFKDLPNNSEFRSTSFILPFELFPASKDDWHNYNIIIYAQLNESSTAGSMSAKIKQTLSQKAGKQKSTHELFLLPMKDWHLHADFENHQPVKSESLKLVWFYGFIGAFVLLLACINFMNLSTARSEKRAKEVGIRKTIGSSRKQLLWQFYGESLLLTFVSFLLSLCIVQVVLPWFNQVADKDMHIIWMNPWFWSAGLLFTIITALLAGSYPALYLSSFNAIRVLKGSFHAGKLAALPRKVLVVIQFTVSIGLIIGTAFVYLQILYARNRPVGYSQSGLITQYMVSPDFQQKYEVLKRAFVQTGTLENIAQANYPLTNTLGSNGGFYWEGRAPVEGEYFNTIRVGQSYGATIGWQLTQGRDFLQGLAADSASVILNESAVKMAGLTNPVGQTVKWQPGNELAKNYTIIGVVKDMVKESPFQSAVQSVIFLGRGNWLFASIKNNISMYEALPKLATAFKEVFPNLPFDYSFVDEEYAAKFAAEERVGKLAAVFASLAILISCLGLFGLSTYIAEQRTKEIGIRKVLGASVFSIWRLLSKEFALLILISCLLAIPASWYFLNGWLQNYSYHVPLSWWVFFAGGFICLLLALVAVSVQAMKSAAVNPATSLRTE